MNILMISEFFPPIANGGGEISAFLVAKHLNKKGIRVEVLTSFIDKPADELQEGVKIFRRLSSGSPSKISGNIKRMFSFEKSLIAELIKLDKENDYDIIHCMNTNSISAVNSGLTKKFIMHVNGPTPFCPKATLMYKDKSICHKECTRGTYLDCYLHSNLFGKMNLNPFIKFNPLTIYFARKRYESYQDMMRRFDFFMPISSFMQTKLKDMDIEEDKIEVIYNLMDFKPMQEKKGTGVLYLGEYTNPKGAHIAFEALNGEEINADFYGEGNLKNRFLREAKSNMKIHSKISYSDVPKIINEHEIVVFPSLVGEAFGRVALEATLLGKVVVASRIGGVTDIIQDKITGFLFEPGNVSQLRNIVHKIQKKQLILDTNKSRKILKERFSNEDSISKVISIYKKISSK